MSKVEAVREMALDALGDGVTLDPQAILDIVGDDLDAMIEDDEVNRLRNVVALAIGRLERHEPGAALTGLRAGQQGGDPD